MQKIISKREKLILLITVGVIVFSVLFNFVFLPVMSMEDALSKDVESAKSRLKKYHTLIAHKDLIYQQYNKVSGQLSSGESASKPSEDILSQIEYLATLSDIHIIDIRPQVSGGAANARPLVVDLKTEGSMDQQLRFIYNLENPIFLLKIQRLQLNSKSGDNNMEGEFSVVKSNISG